MPKKLPSKGDVEAGMQDNETWNTCPSCNHSWKDKVATPGLLHRTRLCENCRVKVENRRRIFEKKVN